MRIVMALPAFLPAMGYGGPVTNVVRLCQGLRELGIETSVITSTLADGQGGRLPEGPDVEAGIPVDRLSVVAARGWAPLVRWRAPRGPVDIMHVGSVWNGLSYAALRWAQSEGIPTIWETMGMLGVQGRSRGLKRLLTPLNLRLARRSHGLVVTAPRELEEAPPAFRRVHHWMRPNPPALPSAAPVPSRLEARQALGLPIEGPLWGFLGRVADRKGIPRLLAAWREAGGAGHLCIAGPVEHEPLAAAVRETPGAILLPPIPRPEVRTYLRALDALLLVPDYGENFGNVVIEAIDAGTPAVLSRAVGSGHWLAGRGAVVLDDPLKDLITCLREGAFPPAPAGLPDDLGLMAVALRQRQIYEEVLRS